MTIKELRAKLNLSQSQFGGIIGVDRSDLGKMENGKKKIPDHIINKIWAEFGVEVTDVPEQKPVKRANTPKLEIYIQSPLGGNITPEEVAAKIRHALESARPSSRYRVTPSAWLLEAAVRVVPQAWSDPLLARRMPAREK
jgi:transcriptional regulator with XRE-family HTH domain